MADAKELISLKKHLDLRNMTLFMQYSEFFWDRLGARTAARVFEGRINSKILIKSIE